MDFPQWEVRLLAVESSRRTLCERGRQLAPDPPLADDSPLTPPPVSHTRPRHSFHPRRMPYHLGRETWHGYDTKAAWFWQAPKPRREIGTGPAAKKLA